MSLKKEVTTNKINLIEKKVAFFHDVIQKTLLHIQHNKPLDIVGIVQINDCIHVLDTLNEQLISIMNLIETQKDLDIDNIVNILQKINNELSGLFKNYGTHSFEDFLWICSGNNSINNYIVSDMDKYKFDILKKYFHPTCYKVLNQMGDETTVNGSNTTNKGKGKEKDKDKKVFKCRLNEKSKNLDCCDVDIKTNNFYLKVHGFDIIIHNTQQKKSLVITGIVDDISIKLLNNKFIQIKTKSILENVPVSLEFQNSAFTRYVNSLCLKEYLIYEPHELYSRYAGFVSCLKSLKLKTLDQLVKEFVKSDLFSKRQIIMKLLLKSDEQDNLYLAYLLYDLLTNDNTGSIDTQEQMQLFDSFPWEMKQYFTEAINKTNQYTKNIMNFDFQKIPLEQQICLLKTTDNVKEKAMQKLKEVKAKSEDTGSKARQYLEGLLKIPFGVYKKEPILNLMDEIRIKYNNFVKLYGSNTIMHKDNITSLEILHNIRLAKNSITNTHVSFVDSIFEDISQSDKSKLVTLIYKINECINIYHLEFVSLKPNNKTKPVLVEHIKTFVEQYKTNYDILKYVFGLENGKTDELTNVLKDIEHTYSNINTSMIDVRQALDNAVYGHKNAKTQIERIVGQWINGKQDGYCFGFEGPPGIGKTSLAIKGLANCLTDENGDSRPFAMIQVAGDAIGATLHGHNYTFVGSSWGSIVQILMDKKCMNPIIFVDEVDKISKTEHGKEIIGILTHLLDPAQNDRYQDKYFSGIDLDLSKALFVLSYNDVELIDRVMLDRVHRIKFNNLTLEEKVVIANKHLLPEIYSKMGLQNVIHIPEDVLEFIIDEFTYEAGVRKLKEILFEIVGEINLDILKNFNVDYTIPIHISIDDITNIYFKDKHHVRSKKIHQDEKVGMINGLWANSQGKGGVIPIQSKWCPSEKFLHLDLTGMQGDVMKESMKVALTLAWNLTPESIKEKLLQDNNRNGANGINGVHIHCPEGSTPKDGPSAGTAITTTLWSLLNNKPIRHNVAITGEITLDGNVTEIGGLDLKFLGGIKAGVTEFLFPYENKKDYDAFMKKYKDDKIIEGISFTMVNTIEEVFAILF
uniref:Lon proteolytic domain-containing protein n=1 Tax=viral metagenome TaxID=1070528 RepID=A0A6C0IVT6_9ZZZZ